MHKAIKPLEVIIEDLELRFLPEALYPMGSHHRDDIEASLLLRTVAGTDRLMKALEDVQTVFICFTNRVGSNLFSDLLDQAGFGVRVAEEDFNSSSVLGACQRDRMDSFDQYLAYVVNMTKRDRTFFCKIGIAQLLWLTNRGFVQDFFPSAKFIFVRRRDKIAQAVSLYIADETGQYTIGPEQDAMDTVGVPFHKEKIASKLLYIQQSEHLFAYFFALHSVVPLEIWYEEFATRPYFSLKKVAEFCGDASKARLGVIRKVNIAKARVRSQWSCVNHFLCDEMRKAFALA
jgi:LPS sulfotransferase NodH